MSHNLDSKRLALYPKQVQRIKRLRKQIHGLNRCIGKLKDKNEFSERMSNRVIDTLIENRSESDALPWFAIGAVVGFLAAIVGRL